MPRIDVTKNWVRRRVMSPKACAPGSFRFKRLGKGKAAIICCPRGEFSKGRCRVGTRAQSLLTPRKR